MASSRSSCDWSRSGCTYFAQVLAPLSALSFDQFLIIWDALLIATLVWLGGLWALAFCVIPFIPGEISYGNLHLLLASFYRPTSERFRILIEDTAFPSDSYAVASQARWHGLDPREAVLRVPLGGLGDAIERAGESLALVLLPGVSYLTGEVLDVAALTAAAHGVGAIAGWDLAHSIGNVQVPNRLHGELKPCLVSKAWR